MLGLELGQWFVCPLNLCERMKVVVQDANIHDKDRMLEFSMLSNVQNLVKFRSVIYIIMYIDCLCFYQIVKRLL